MGRIVSKVKDDVSAVPAGLVADEVVKQAIGKEARFTIVELAPGGLIPVYDSGGEIVIFQSGKEAAKEAEVLSKKSDKKYQPRPVVSDGWKEREQKRMDTGKYTLLPWHEERWWQDLKHVWGDHYPHVAIYKGARVAFTETPEKGGADLQTPIKPGKYLEQFFGSKSILSNYVIRDLCTRFSAKHEDNLLLWADNEEDIVDTFVNGPNSCMTKPARDYASAPHHPCSVYATPDIKVAYLMRDGRIVARAVCHVNKKTYNNIYGDRGRIEPLLKKAGYENAPPFGARLKKIVIQERKDGSGNFAFVTPHLDNIGLMEDRGDPDYVFILDKGVSRLPHHLECGGARGITEWATKGCASCDNKAAISTKHMKAVYADLTCKTLKYMCTKCAEDKTKAAVCQSTGHMFLRELLVEIPNSKGKFVVPARLGDYVFTCAGDGQQYPRNQALRGIDGKLYCKAEFSKLHDQCVDCSVSIERKEGNTRCQHCVASNALRLKKQGMAAKAKTKSAKEDYELSNRLTSTVTYSTDSTSTYGRFR